MTTLLEGQAPANSLSVSRCGKHSVQGSGSQAALVPAVDESADDRDELAHAGEDAAPDRLAGDDSEEHLDQYETS
jgi:hypothetical protein